MNKVNIKYISIFGLAMVCFAVVHHHVLAQAGVEEPLRDSVFLKKGDFIFRDDSFRLIEKDTVMFLDNGSYKVDKENYEKTQLMYDSLSKKMDQSWITKEMYSLLFSSVAKSSIASRKSDYVQPEDAFLEFDGMTIRNIYLNNVAVLDGSVDDTLLIPTTSLGKLANDLHMDTRKWVIRQYLLFKPGDRVNPYTLADNERIIRSLDFIQDARIVLKKISGDEVSVFIITQDVFSIGAGGNFHGFRDFDVEVFDKNIFGLGNELRVGVLYNNRYEKPFGFGAEWNYNNIKGSLVDASLRYENTFERENIQQIVSKRFLSPDIKYGGELNVGWKRDVLYDYRVDTVYENAFQQRYFDWWMGRSFLLNTREKRMNVIFAARYGKSNFLNRPLVEADTNVFFHDNEILLASVSLKKVNYFKSHKILGFGVVEDIPYGFIFRLLWGESYSEFFNRPYGGFQLSGGKYMEDFGYLWLDSKLGTFWKKGSLNEMLLNINAVYFAPLYDLGRYENRIIVKASYNAGVNHQDERGLNFFRSVRGFDDRAINGKSSYILGLESIFFAPWYLYGFKLAPYAFADVGVVSDKSFGLQNLRAYPSFGIGMRIRNESLVISTISFRFAFIPIQFLGASHFNIDGSASEPYLFNDGFDDKPTFNMLRVN